jgi:hypothetical protein
MSLRQRFITDAMPKKTRTRRLRRQNKQVLRHGSAAKPSHKLKSGRTGKAHSAKLKSRRS